MAEKQEKNPEQEALEKLQKAQAVGNAISHLGLKLGMIRNEMTIEEQMKSLAKYNDIPSINEIKGESNNLDSYRFDFLNDLYNQYFIDYPEMLERLGEKKTDNSRINFQVLMVMEYLYKSPDAEKDKDKQKANVSEYYTLLSKYQEFLINYIVDNQKWNLTNNSKEAFLAYADIYNEHTKILKENPHIQTQIAVLIKNIRIRLFEKITNLKETGLDNETYDEVVTTYLINKFVALRYILNIMAGGGMDVLAVYSAAIFKDYSINSIYSFACEIEEKLELNEKQKNELSETKKMLDLFKKKGIGGASSSGSGCILLLLLFFIPASFMAYLFI